MALILKSNKAVSDFTNGNLLDYISADELLLGYMDRVKKDGGEIINQQYLRDLCVFLTENKLLGKVHTIVSANLGIKRDSSSTILKLYNLIDSSDVEPKFLDRSDLKSIPKIRDVTESIAAPKFTQDKRCSINLNNSSESNFSQLKGNILFQETSGVSASSTLDAFAVFERVFDSNDATVNEGYAVCSFTENFSENNRVFFATSKNKSATTGSGAWVYVSDDRADGIKQEFGYFYSSSSAVPEPMKYKTNSHALKDAVMHFYCRDTGGGTHNVGAAFKASLTSDNYTDHVRTLSAANKVTKAMQGDKRLIIGGSCDKFDPTVFGATGENYMGQFINWKIYDFFLMRDIHESEKAILIRDFLESQVKQAWGRR